MKTFDFSILKTAGWNPETTVPVDQAETIAEAIKAGHFGSESDILHAANATRRVRANRTVRDLLAEKPESTVEDVRAAVNGTTYKQREPGSGKGKPSGKVKALESKLSAAQDALKGVKLSAEARAALVAAGVLTA